jgi:predicted PurR-regulated permease PerM
MKESSLLDEKLKKVLLIIGYMIIVAGVVYALTQLRGVITFILNVLAPFVVALIIAYIFDPIVTFVQKRLGLSRIWGLVVLFGCIIFVLGLFLLYFVPLLYHQTIEVFKALKDAIPRAVEGVLERFNIRLDSEQMQEIAKKVDLAQLDAQTVLAALTPGLKSIAAGGVSAAGAVARGVATGVGWVLSLVSFIGFVVVIMLYFLVDFGKIHGVLETVIPAGKEKRVFEILGKLDVAVGGFLRGQLIDAFIVGVLTTVGLFILGMKKYALLVGFIAGVGNLVPYLGSIVGVSLGIVWVGLSSTYPALSDKAIGAGEIILLFIVIQSIEGYVLQPMIVGKKSQLSPLAMLLALIAGAQFGIGGMIVAVPIACIARVLLKEFWWDPLVERKRAAKASTIAT